MIFYDIIENKQKFQMSILDEKSNSEAKIQNDVIFSLLFHFRSSNTGPRFMIAS